MFIPRNKCIWNYIYSFGLPLLNNQEVASPPPSKNKFKKHPPHPLENEDNKQALNVGME